jgi:hypothetical protein
MALVLQPAFSDKTREEIEQHLLVVRARRMAAVVTYYAGVNAKNLHLIIKDRQRIAREYAMLARELVKMDKLDAIVETRLAKLTQLQQELDIHQSNMVEIADDREESRAAGGGDKKGANGEYKRASGAVRSGRPPGA